MKHNYNKSPIIVPKKQSIEYLYKSLTSAQLNLISLIKGNYRKTYSSRRKLAEDNY